VIEACYAHSYRVHHLRVLRGLALPRLGGRSLLSRQLEIRLGRCRALGDAGGAQAEPRRARRFPRQDHIDQAKRDRRPARLRLPAAALRPEAISRQRPLPRRLRRNARARSGDRPRQDRHAARLQGRFLHDTRDRLRIRLAFRRPDDGEDRPQRLGLHAEETVGPIQATGAQSTSSICVAPEASITSRSKPRAMPALSGMPCARAARKSSSIG
jgi:hypothetical protein